jgi:hypothetical protein
MFTSMHWSSFSKNRANFKFETLKLNLLCMISMEVSKPINYLIHFFFFIASVVRLSPLHCGHFWPTVPAPDDRWGWLWSNWWNEDWQGKPKYSEKTCPCATSSTTNPTWPDPGCHGGKPVTNCLSYGAASHTFSLWWELGFWFGSLLSNNHVYLNEFTTVQIVFPTFSYK